MSTGALVQCTFFGNGAPYGGNISSDCSSNTSISGCIVAASVAGEGVYKDSSSEAVLDCTDIFGNAGGDWVEAIADQYGVNGNICLDPLFCDAENGDFTLREGSPCLPEFNPDCGLIGALGQGCSGPSGIVNRRDGHGGGLCLANFPNPFNPLTTIRFDLPEPYHVRLSIFSLDGRHVATLQEGSLAAGLHEVTWTGRDARGGQVASGTYIYRLEAGGHNETGRMLLIR